jgi:hypothetical protein
MKKTKTVDGKELTAKSFAYVGDKDDPSTWKLPIHDKDHVQDALSRFDQAELPASAKAKVAKKLVAAAKRFGIDASGFAKEYVTKEADMSFDDIECELQDELLEEFGTDSFNSPLYCLVQVFPDYLIARGPDVKLYRIPYTMDDSGEADLGEPQEVEMAYVPVSQAGAFLVAQADSGLDEWSFPVQVMQAGWAHGELGGAKNIPHYFPFEVVAQVAEAVNGAKFGRKHPASGIGADEPERIAGWLDGGKVVGSAAHGVIHLLQNETELQAKLSAARAQNKLDLFGTSVLAIFQFKGSKVEGKDALVATKLGKLVSVDLCAEAGAGGKFLQYAASRSAMAEISQLEKASVATATENPAARSAGRHLGEAMKERIQKLLGALRKHNAERATTLETEFATVKEADYAEFLLKLTEASHAAIDNAQPVAVQDVAVLVRESKAALDEAKKMRSANLVETKLTASKLPAPAMKIVREHLAGLIVDEAAVDAEIKLVREAFASYSQIGRVGSGHVSVGLETRDKVQLAMDLMLGVKESGQQAYAAMMHKPVLGGDASVTAFRGIKDAYFVITGDRDLNFGRNGIGGFTRVTEAVATTDFPNILLDSMLKRLIQDYQEVGMNGLEQVITEGPALADYRTQSRVREGYFGDLPTVAEAGPYTELTKPTDEKVTYAPVKKGGLLTVSEETIRADDLGKIKQFPQRLARAGRHTLKTFISNFFINNPNYVPDGVAWYNASHNNLVTTPLSVDNLIAAEIAQMKQTEKDSGNRLPYRISWLQVPVDLAPLAWQINNSQFYNPGPAINVPNPFYKRFGEPGTGSNAPKGIIVNEIMADTNDWYWGVDINQVPTLEIAYLDGISSPQIFLADLQTQGTQFTNDQIQYKVKFAFGGAILDFRGTGKAVVP